MPLPPRLGRFDRRPAVGWAFAALSTADVLEMAIAAEGQDGLGGRSLGVDARHAAP